MHQGCASIGLHACAGGFARLLVRRASVNDRTAGFDRVNLAAHCTFRDHDMARNAANLRRKRKRDTVVARRMGDHATRGHVGIKRKDRIACATKLEGADPLQLLAFEMQACLTECVQGSRGRHGREPGMCGNASGSGQDIEETGLDGSVGSHAVMLTQPKSAE